MPVRFKNNARTVGLRPLDGQCRPGRSR